MADAKHTPEQELALFARIADDASQRADKAEAELSARRIAHRELHLRLARVRGGRGLGDRIVAAFESYDAAIAKATGSAS